MTAIDLEPPDDESRRLWSGVGDLVDLLPAEWVLIGGLMVQLHALELGVRDVRVTTDVDLLAQARPPGPLSKIDSALQANGFEAQLPDVDGYAHRYEHDGLIVDVVAPDGIKPPPVLAPGRLAVGVPGGSQALERQEDVTVHLDGRSFDIRRPTLLGAILMKARALMVHNDPEAQREDLLLLLSLVGDPRAMAEDLKRSERRWLRNAEERLAFERPANVGPDRLTRARLTLRLLLRER